MSSLFISRKFFWIQLLGIGLLIQSSAFAAFTRAQIQALQTLKQDRKHFEVTILESPQKEGRQKRSIILLSPRSSLYKFSVVPCKSLEKIFKEFKYLALEMPSLDQASQVSLLTRLAQTNNKGLHALGTGLKVQNKDFERGLVDFFAAAGLFYSAYQCLDGVSLLDIAPVAATTTIKIVYALSDHAAGFRTPTEITEAVHEAALAGMNRAGVSEGVIFADSASAQHFKSVLTQGHYIEREIHELKPRRARVPRSSSEPAPVAGPSTSYSSVSSSLSDISQEDSIQAEAMAHDEIRLEGADTELSGQGSASAPLLDEGQAASGSSEQVHPDPVPVSQPDLQQAALEKKWEQITQRVIRNRYRSK